MNQNRDRDPLRGLRVPGAPEELRRRALQAAQATSPEIPASSIWDRLWEDRRLRRAWSTAVALLLAGHALVGLLPSPGPSPPPTSGERSPGIGELREVLELPPLEISPRAETLVMGASRPASAPQRSAPAEPSI
jgi:hypothetical protein